MAIIDSFKVNATNVEFSWPAEVTGLERTMLSAHDEIQHLLSAFSSRTINMKTIYEHTSPRTHTASSEQPITQRREVYLLCGGKTACIATSDMIITVPLPERLFLDETFATGQDTAKDILWRRYILSTRVFVCDITDLFTDRDMFTLCEQWLDEERANAPKAKTENSQRRYATNAVLVHV